MSDESEESCLVSAKSTQSPCMVSASAGSMTPAGDSKMPYTDGYAVHSSNNKSPSSTGSDYPHQQHGSASAAGDYVRMSVGSLATHSQNQQQQIQHDQQPVGRSMSQSRGRGSQQSQASETGELIDFNEDIVLSQFHADAMKQVDNMNNKPSTRRMTITQFLSAGWLRTFPAHRCCHCRSGALRTRHPSLLGLLYFALGRDGVLHS